MRPGHASSAATARQPDTLPCKPESASGTGPATAGAQTWPGGASVTVADQTCAWKTTTGPEGRDMSGLVFDPTNPDVLYAVKNKSWVFRLVKQGDLWVPDTANGLGRRQADLLPRRHRPARLRGPDGRPRRCALRHDRARQRQQHLRPELGPALRPDRGGHHARPDRPVEPHCRLPRAERPDTGKANLGFEGVTFVPDTYLVQNGFVDQSTGSTYYPSDYPGHGAGLFFAALENDGKLYAYALNADGTLHRVAVVDTGMGHVMDVQFDADPQRIWALCDNTCRCRRPCSKVDATGAIVPDVVYARRPACRT